MASWLALPLGGAHNRPRFMSFNSHRRALHDTSLPLEYRASHARSCALHVANKLGVKREAVIEIIKQKTGINLHAFNSEENLLKAFTFLEALRQGQEVLHA